MKHLLPEEEIPKSIIGANTPDYSMRAFCQQEAEKCARKMKLAAVEENDEQFDKFSRKKERWLSKMLQFDADDATQTQFSGNVAKRSQQKVLLKDIVNLPTFKKDIPPLQIQGECKHRHNKAYSKYATIGDFFEDFESYLRLMLKDWLQKVLASRIF